MENQEYIDLTISTHAPRVRRDRHRERFRGLKKYFYSRASCEARRGRVGLHEVVIDFYSRASCEARL